MRRYAIKEPPRDIDPRVYEILKQIRGYIDQSQGAFAKLARGERPDGSSASLTISDHGLLTGLSDDDHTIYALLAGRSGGQTLIGDPTTSGTSSTPTLILANFNNSAITGAQRITLKGGGSGTGQIKIETNNLQLVERGQTTGWDFFTGVGYVNLTAIGSISLQGVLGTDPVLTVTHGAAGLTATIAVFKRRSGATGAFTQWRNSDDTVYSYIRGTDGAFVGPVAPTSGAVPTSRLISTTAPLTGGGDLSADRTLAVSTFSSVASGVVPASGGGTSNYLRADGTWAAPAGGGGTTSIARTLALMGG